MDQRRPGAGRVHPQSRPCDEGGEGGLRGDSCLDGWVAVAERQGAYLGEEVQHHVPVSIHHVVPVGLLVVREKRNCLVGLYK